MKAAVYARVSTLVGRHAAAPVFEGADQFLLLIKKGATPTANRMSCKLRMRQVLLDLACRGKRFRQIRGNLGLRPECHRLYRNGHGVTDLCSRSLEHGVADPEPVASYSVRLKRCLKGVAVKRAFNHLHPA